MSVVSILKRLVPARLRPLLRRGVRLLRGKSLYDSRVQRELEAFENINVQDLPLIMQYWSKNYLAPSWRRSALPMLSSLCGATWRASVDNFRLKQFRS